MKLKTLVVLVLALFISCKKKTLLDTSINGVWKSVGSGWILQIQDSTQYSFYDINSVACLPSREAHLDELIESLTLQEDTLSLLKGIMTYKFTRVKRLPELCSETLSEEKKKDPIYNFEVFAATVKEHYAFMELNKINWPVLYKQQKQRLNKNPTEIELYNILEETLDSLNDNHAYLEATEDFYTQMTQIATEEHEQQAEEELPEYGDFQIADMVAKHHLEEDMTKDSWLIKWGKMKDQIGFVQIKAMWLYADLEIPKSLIEKVGYVDAYVKTFHQMDEGSYIKKEAEGVRKIMDRVMSDLSDTKMLVIDLRFNGGGQDAVNFEILRRFNDKKKQIVTTKLKYKNSFSPLLRIYLEPSKPSYNKPVFVLTSQQTGSASEAFAIGSMALSNIKRIGMPTQGALSTALEKKLPNGWTFSISNEIYMDNNLNSYENIGVPVDYQIVYPDDRQTFFRSVANDLVLDKQKILAAIVQFQKD